MRLRLGRPLILFSLAVLVPLSLNAANNAFGPPAKVTPPLGYGYEPTVVADRYGNIFATAHKENWQLVVAPDTNSPLYTRSMSWAWASVDGGKDGTPFPVDRATYDKTIEVMRDALNRAQIDRSEKVKAFRRLSEFEPVASS